MFCGQHGSHPYCLLHVGHLLVRHTDPWYITQSVLRIFPLKKLYGPILILFLGYPAEVYGYGTQIFMNSIVVIITVPPSIYFFMVVFYKMQLTSVYEVKEKGVDWAFPKLLFDTTPRDTIWF